MLFEVPTRAPCTTIIEAVVVGNIGSDYGAAN
jgi:hypothetical protein